MVNINLYKKKKSKLKLTTVLVLIGIFLLPVIALRITIENIKTSNLSEIKGKYPYSRSFMGNDNIEAVIKQIQNENSLLISKTTRINAETERIKKDLVYAGLSTDLISELGVQFARFKANEKIFIEAMRIRRGEDFFLKYYNVDGRHMNRYMFSESLKKAYRTNGLALDDKRMTIDFMLVNILQEELTVKTAKY